MKVMVVFILFALMSCSDNKQNIINPKNALNDLNNDKISPIRNEYELYNKFLDYRKLFDFVAPSGDKRIIRLMSSTEFGPLAVFFELINKDSIQIYYFMNSKIHTEYVQIDNKIDLQALFKLKRNSHLSNKLNYANYYISIWTNDNFYTSVPLEKNDSTYFDIDEFKVISNEGSKIMDNANIALQYLRTIIENDTMIKSVNLFYNYPIID